MRSVAFVLLLGATLLLFWSPTSTLIRLSLQQEHYSHIVLIPLISAALVVHERRKIFGRIETGRAGVVLLAAGALLHSSVPRVAAPASENDRLGLAMAALVLIWIGAFVLCYGLSAARQALFPLLFLVLMIPVPDFLLHLVVAALLVESAAVSHVMLELVGVPFLRTGLVFAFPGFAIEIAEECSGIRSSLALLVVSLLAGHLFLRSLWTRTVLILAAVPLLIIKNGLRIVTLSLLTLYVDPGTLTGSLHRQGGVAFFLLTMALLAPVLWFLQNSERRRASGEN